ncbi:MAG: hypothetical protein ACRC62_10490 [Microcoleus sp.]
MNQNHWRGDRALIATRIIAVSIGAIALGYPTFASAAASQQTPSECSSSIAPSSENSSEKKCIDRVAKVLTSETLTQQVQIKSEFFANASTRVPLKKGMPYQEARQILIQQGWRPNLEGETNLNSLTVKELFDFGYREIQDCAGTGEGPCRFEFVNRQGEQLVVVATTMGNPNNIKRFVRNWWIEKKDR